MARRHDFLSIPEVIAEEIRNILHVIVEIDCYFFAFPWKNRVHLAVFNFCVSRYFSESQ